MKRPVLYVLLALVVLALLYLFVPAVRGGISRLWGGGTPKNADDEAPIIVKNGSLHITSRGTWRPENNGWVNDTGTQNNGGDLWVKLTSNAGSCTVSGQPLDIDDSEPGVGLHVITANTHFGLKTFVTSQSAVQQVGDHELTTGTSGGSNAITKVRARGSECKVPNGADPRTVEIRICSSGSVADCQ